MTLKQLKKRLNPVAQKYGYYTAYELDAKEFVGDAPNKPPFHRWFVNAGYESPPKVMGVQLSATKLHPDTGEVHDFTIRRVDPDNPRWQWHVHLWYMQGETEIYSHYEMRPDMRRIDGEDKAEMIGRLKIHYRPSGDEYREGYKDHVVAKLLND